ncbi:methionine ABC transporter ATP-binding protein [Georgenia thermotolerans]|uniref:ATP-binding cassette domain-containing protein n=1 Tax=Georgenia thermotolerans TaxID=527326 RepID=A0A7J5UN21_9MICO|nr:ATP-binding cassette domain-containing protein [Georgenia thermotolerans]KAE8763641.1 ATP-binding cassette domain-containing protein [Georgenia thermotolerans]
MSEIIRLEGVHKSFGEGPGAVHAVEDVTLSIDRGEIFGVIGYSGAGKSTLVRLINGLETVTSGRLVVDGAEISAMREKQLREVRPEIGMIFQQFNLFPSKTVAENVAYPLRVAGWDKARREARVAELLSFVGLADKARARPTQLSGGQKQRVGIARALASEPKILLADEATSALDPETTRDILGLLRRVNAELGITIVVITHEMDVVKYLCRRVAVMERGRVVELGEVYDVFSRPRQDVTRRFVGTSLRDRPSPEVLARLAATHPGTLVTVGIQEDTGSSARLMRTLGEHEVDGAIVYGGITEIGERPFGSLTLALTGEDEAIRRALADLGGYTTVQEYPELEELKR